MTDTVTLKVKWGKETIDLDFIVGGGVKGLKTELEEKTRAAVCGSIWVSRGNEHCSLDFG